jgi:hypothetical protein
MRKLSRNSLGECNKSCSVPHQESSKIEFAFFRFFYDFLEILQDSAKAATLFKKQLTSRSLELLIPHKNAPGSHKEPWNFSQACNVPLEAWPTAAPAKFRPAGSHGRPGAGGRRPVGPWGLDYCARLGQGHHQRARSAEWGSGHRGSYCSDEAVSPAGR